MRPLSTAIAALLIAGSVSAAAQDHQPTGAAQEKAPPAKDKGVQVTPTLPPATVAAAVAEAIRKAEAAEARRAARSSMRPAAPKTSAAVTTPSRRYEVRWPEQRMVVKWPSPADDRVTLKWPDGF